VYGNPEYTPLDEKHRLQVGSVLSACSHCCDHALVHCATLAAGYEHCWNALRLVFCRLCHRTAARSSSSRTCSETCLPPRRTGASSCCGTSTQWAPTPQVSIPLLSRHRRRLSAFTRPRPALHQHVAGGEAEAHLLCACRRDRGAPGGRPQQPDAVRAAGAAARCVLHIDEASLPCAPLASRSKVNRRGALPQVVLGQREELSVFGDDYDTPDGTCVRDYMCSPVPQRTAPSPKHPQYLCPVVRTGRKFVRMLA
jgi:hypothetical protein